MTDYLNATLLAALTRHHVGRMPSFPRRCSMTVVDPTPKTISAIVEGLNAQTRASR